MEKEDRDLLQRAVMLSEENNKILKSMRRSGRVALFFQYAYWVLIIALSIGAYYLIQPYLETLMGSIETFKSLVQ